MAKAKTAQSPELTPYYEISFRLQQVINSPAAQRQRSVLVFRREEEAEPEWDQVIAEIDENENVTVVRRDDGGVEITWVVPRED